MLQVVFKLVDLDSQLLLLIRMGIDMLVLFFELLVILRVVLLKIRLLLLKFDTCLRQLLPQLLDIDRLNTEIARHCQVSVLDVHRTSERSFRLQFVLDRLNSRVYIRLLGPQPLYLLGAKILEFLKLTPEQILVLLDPRRAALHSTALLDRFEGLKSLLQLLVLLHRRVILVILAEEAARGDKALVCCSKILLRLAMVTRLRLAHLPVHVRHRPGHLRNHHFDGRRVECVRFICFQGQQGHWIVHLLPGIPIDPGHDEVFLLRLTLVIFILLWSIACLLTLQKL